MSEVAKLRQQIALECAASWQALYGLASGTTKHQVITSKFRMMEQYCRCLAELVGEEKATEHLVEIWEEQAHIVTPSRKQGD